MLTNASKYGGMEQSGGSHWEVPLGRRDSKTASPSKSNTNIPAPNSTIQNLITFFQRQGLDEEDLVALSGKFFCHNVIDKFYVGH